MVIKCCQVIFWLTDDTPQQWCAHMQTVCAVVPESLCSVPWLNIALFRRECVVKFFWTHTHLSALSVYLPCHMIWVGRKQHELPLLCIDMLSDESGCGCVCVCVCVQCVENVLCFEYRTLMIMQRIPIPPFTILFYRQIYWMNIVTALPRLLHITPGTAV